MMVDTLEGLRVVRENLNSKKKTTLNDLNIIDKAISEISKLRYTEALLEREIEALSHKIVGE